MINKVYIYSKVILILIVGFSLTGCATANYNSYNSADKLNLTTKKICSQQNKESSPWHINNLYDCNSKSFFIPYQLWSGAKFNGDKSTSKNHMVNNQTLTPYGTKGRYQPLSIIGTTKWKNPSNNVEYKIYTRKRSRKGKIQYFTSYDMGIGRVYDNRSDRYYTKERMKFPAGYGWKLHKKRTLGTTTIEITKMNFNNNELVGIEFKWWTHGILDHIYTYKVNHGVITSLKQH